MRLWSGLPIHLPVNDRNYPETADRIRKIMDMKLKIGEK